MNFKNIVSKLSLILVLLTFFTANAFAQVYVSNTNGNDITGAGTEASPYATILKGYQMAANGQTIYVDADTYPEATLNLTLAKSVTFEAVNYPYNSALTTVTITNGVTMNAAGRTVTFSASGLNFDFGISATALTLTAGTLNLSTNTTISSGGTITRTNGTLVGTPTFGADINVNYGNITASTITAGTELPANYGAGALTVNIGAGKTITFPNTLTAMASVSSIVVTTGHANFNGTVVIYVNGAAAPVITNNGTGNVTFNGTVNFSKFTGTGAVAANHTVQIRNNTTGTLVFEQGYSRTAGTVGGTSYVVHIDMRNAGNAPAKLTFNNSVAAGNGIVTNVGTGTITFTGGTISGDVDNGTGGILVINANTTFAGSIDNTHAASQIKLNSFTLTLSGTTKTVDNNGGGKIYAQTASTVGTGGTVSVSGRYTFNNGGEYPSVTVTGTGGSLILGANTTFYGTFTIAGSRTTGGTEAFNDGGFTLTLYGNFSRTNNTVGNVAATGELLFTGTTAQSFNPGASLTLTDVTINKASNKVTLAASVKIDGDFTITAGELELGDYNINMVNGGIFDNSGSFYSTTNVGYLNFETNGGFIQGTGNFGNILINSDGGNVTLTSNVEFSGTLYLFQGDLDLDDFTFTMTDVLVDHPTVKVNTNPTTSAAVLNTGLGGLNLFDVAAGTTYNLIYVGNLGGVYNAGFEFDTAVNGTEINDFSVLTTAGTTVTGDGVSGYTIDGVLTVNDNETFDLNGQTATLSGDNKTHSVKGTTTDLLYVTGTGVALNGGTLATDDNTVADLEIDNTDGTFSSVRLKSIDNLTNTSGTSTVTLSPAAGTVFNNDVTVTDGQLTLNFSLTAGGVTPIGNDLLVNGGVLALGSDLVVSNDITHDGTSEIQLGDFDLTATNDYTHNNTATFTAGTGFVVFDASADFAGTITLITAVTVPNLEINAPAGVITLATDDLTVSNSFVFTDGTFDLDGLDLYITGGTFVFDVATPSKFDATASPSTLHFTGDATTITVTDAGDTWVNMPDFSTAANQLNVTVNTTGNTLTFADDPDNGPFDFTVDGIFTQTMGHVALGDNNLILNEDFVRVDGTWSQGDGFMIWNSASGSYTTGDNFIIDNLEIQANMADTDDKPWTVNKYLLLTGGTLTTTTAGNLVFSDNATIERTLTTALLGEVPTFGADMTVIYSGTEAADITTDNELPATVKNLTIDRTAAAPNNDILLDKNLLVTGTLFLKNGILNENTKALTLANNATLERQAGGRFLAGDVPTVTNYNLVYSGGTSFATLASDFMAGLISLQVKMGAGAFVSLHANNSVNGLITINSNATGGLDLNNKTLTAKQDVTHTAGRIQGTGGGVLVMGGDVAQTLTVPAAGLTFPFAGTAQLRINNSTEAGVTLAGGNFTLSTTNAANAVDFVKGVFRTGANTLVLWHGDNGSQPLQAFTRNVAVGSYSHVVGKVKKYIDATGTGARTTTPAVALTRVEFPVGTAPASPGNYRPMSVQFNTLPTANFNLTVSHEVASPEGTNGFPLTSGDLTITNYPGFYWLVKSDLTLQPQVKYDIEARADGYTDYQTDGVQNIRFIRRFDTNTDNPWLVQGGTGYDNSSLDYLNTPTLLTDDSPVIIVRDAQGAISSQGARFTYSQLNKPPIVSSPADVVANEDEQITVTWTVNDPDIGQTPTFTGVSWTATAPAVVPTNYTFNAGTGTLSWKPTFGQSGVYTVTVTATDGALTKTDAVQITVNNVNRAPSFTAEGAATQATASVKNGAAYSFTYKAIDPDGDALTYSVAINTTPTGTFSIAAALGTLTFNPVFADAGKTFTFTITATDGTLNATTTTAVTVTYAAAKGDVNGNGTIAADDAAEILKYVVGLVTFTPEQLYASDVNNDGTVGALDAAWILYYVANGSFPTAKVSAAMGVVEAGKLQKEADGYLLPINLTNTSGVLSVYSELNIDANIEVLGITARAPQGWLSASRIENGKVTFAMSGLEPLKDGPVAYVKIRIKDIEASATIYGNANLNDGYNSALNSITVREIPTEFTLSQNYPNPFNPTTTIKFAIPENANVRLDVYNMLGQKIRTLMDGMQDAGYYKVNWDGTNDLGGKVSSGIYIYRISAGKYNSTMKMNLLK